MVESKKYRDQMNKKYGTDITNITDPCIAVDYHKKTSLESIQRELSMRQNAHQLRSVNSKQLANEI